MASLSKSVVIQAPVEHLFEYVTAPEQLPEWLPSMVEVRKVQGAGEGQQYEWTYKMIGILLKGQTTVVEYVPNKCAVHQSIGTIKSSWTIGVEPHPEGSRLTIFVEYEVPVPVLGRFAERIALSRNARDFALAFDNVREMLEE